jgi:hypothetical protein
VRKALSKALSKPYSSAIACAGACVPPCLLFVCHPSVAHCAQRLWRTTASARCDLHRQAHSLVCWQRQLWCDVNEWLCYQPTLVGLNDTVAGDDCGNVIHLQQTNTKPQCTCSFLLMPCKAAVPACVRSSVPQACEQTDPAEAAPGDAQLAPIPPVLKNAESQQHSHA